MRTDLALKQNEDGTWKQDPYISVSHDEPLTDEQVEAFRELGRLTAAKMESGEIPATPETK